MNSAKQKELALENGQLKIHIRAIEDRLVAADKQLSDKTIHLAVVCYAFKKYIAVTSAPASEPMTDEECTAKLNVLIQDAMKEINAEFEAKENVPNDKV